MNNLDFKPTQQQEKTNYKNNVDIKNSYNKINSDNTRYDIDLSFNLFNKTYNGGMDQTQSKPFFLTLPLSLFGIYLIFQIANGDVNHFITHNPIFNGLLAPLKELYYMIR